MSENPTRLPERVPSGTDPPAIGGQQRVKKKRTVRWRLSGFFNLRKLKGRFEGEREVSVEKFDH